MSTQLKQSDIPDLRSRLLTEQGGLCFICQKQPKQPVLDHSHTKKTKGTGLIRGVLCSQCNVFLAKVENNCTRYLISHEELPDILRKMAKYLEKEHLPYIHPSEKPKRPKLKKSSYNKLVKAHKEDLNKATGKRVPKLHPYPKSKVLTKPLERLFALYNIKPEYYKQ